MVKLSPILTTLLLVVRISSLSGMEVARVKQLSKGIIHLSHEVLANTITRKILQAVVQMKEVSSLLQ